MLLAGALWRICCRQGSVGTEDCWQGRCSGRDAAGQGAPQWQRYCRQGRRGREWEAGTATSTGKESNLPEGGTIGKTLQAWALQRRAIGKMLQAGALQRRAIGKQAGKEPQLQARKKLPLQAGEEHPVLQANKKESGKTHSLLSPF